jgi:hypothetical protein
MEGNCVDGTVLTALVSGGVALVTVAITQPIAYFFSRKRDHDSDWRKMKLEQYKEYVAALSGTVHHPYDSAVQRRYSDAVNSMGLVASPKVLVALYEFLDETSFTNIDRTAQKYDSLLSSLMRAMRADSHPKLPNDSSGFIFQTLNCPPDHNEDSIPDAMRSERTKR